jgi:hypothetical protein
MEIEKSQVVFANLAVREIGGVGVVRDTELAEALGFERPRDALAATQVDPSKPGELTIVVRYDHLTSFRIIDIPMGIETKTRRGQTSGTIMDGGKEVARFQAKQGGSMNHNNETLLEWAEEIKILRQENQDLEKCLVDSRKATVAAVNDRDRLSTNSAELLADYRRMEVDCDILKKKSDAQFCELRELRAENESLHHLIEVARKEEGMALANHKNLKSTNLGLCARIENLEAENRNLKAMLSPKTNEWGKAMSGTLNAYGKTEIPPAVAAFMGLDRPETSPLNNEFVGLGGDAFGNAPSQRTGEAVLAALGDNEP